MEQIRSRVDEMVADPETADALKPWYRQFCKRPCFHDDYLATFNRPNVTLVDTKGQGVDRITEKGIMANGVEYELDCIIFATGFEVGTAYTRRAGYDITGRGGLTLSDKWADGLRTLHGFQTNGFPNCFFMGVTQGGFTANFPHMLNEQSLHIAYMISEVMDGNANCLEPSVEGEDEWVDTIKRMAMFNQKFLEEYAGAPPELTALVRDMIAPIFGAGWDAVAAIHAVGYYALGTWDLGVEGEGMFDTEEPYIHHFPDGNASIARLLVRSLIPEVGPPADMEQVVTARLDYSRLDRAGSPIRLRLESTRSNT